jgi:AraC-like DNA-binding protein
MSAHVQHRSPLLDEDRRQRRGEDRRRERHTRLSSTLARGRVRPPCRHSEFVHRNFLTSLKRVSGRNGLAAWQQLVLVAHIETHIAKALSIRALAHVVCLSHDFFRRAFKRSYGLPPRRYLVQRRIQRAKTLLACSAWTISDVSLALGFRRTRSFSAAFRPVTEMISDDGVHHAARDSGDDEVRRNPASLLMVRPLHGRGLRAARRRSERPLLCRCGESSSLETQLSACSLG